MTTATQQAEEAARAAWLAGDRARWGYDLERHPLYARNAEITRLRQEWRRGLLAGLVLAAVFWSFSQVAGRLLEWLR